MSISFPALLIYLLPGFLGLWVFKGIVQEVQGIRRLLPG